MNRFGEILAELRRDRRLSQKDLAAVLLHLVCRKCNNFSYIHQHNFKL